MPGDLLTKNQKQNQASKRRCVPIGTNAKETQTLINEAIDVREVRVVDAEGQPLGIMSSREALRLAYDKDMDLVLIAPQAQPPVCKIMDYGKYCFEKQKREKEAKKKQQTVELKEIQISYRIDTHDYETKLNQARKFLSSGNKVRVVMKFRGREMSHMAMGRDILEKFLADTHEVGSCDKKPVLEGRFMSMVINPLSNKAKLSPCAAPAEHGSAGQRIALPVRQGTARCGGSRKPSGSYFRREPDGSARFMIQPARRRGSMIDLHKTRVTNITKEG